MSGGSPTGLAVAGSHGHPTLPVDGMATISLQELAEAAALTRRYDAKYVVAREYLPALIDAVRTRMRVLDVDGRRCSEYASVYFDTPDLRTYRDHVMERRRRFKLRTRHYGDVSATMLELKLKGGSGQTLKFRWPHQDAPDRLGEQGHRLAAETLAAEYGLVLPEPLEAVIATSYRRTTLVDVDAGERVTIDEDLTIRSHDREVRLGAGVAVVEAKAIGIRGQGVRALGDLGLRPDRISKYCVAIAASYDDVRGNPWLPVLRQMVPSEG